MWDFVGLIYISRAFTGIHATHWLQDGDSTVDGHLEELLWNLLHWERQYHILFLHLAQGGRYDRPLGCSFFLSLNSLSVFSKRA